MNHDSLIPTLDETLDREGAAAAVATLARALEDQKDWRRLLDAKLLQARVDLNLPPVLVDSLSSLPEPGRTQYEERYVEALRDVGNRLIAAGDIPAAWPYFRVLGEKEAIANALDNLDIPRDDPQIPALIEIAFSSGAHPRRGYEMLLSHYGICSAITAFEQLPPDEATRSACAALLVRNIHQQLSGNVRADIEQRGEAPPPADATLAQLLADRDFLLADEAYHIDISHLASIVRLSPLLDDRDALTLAYDLCAYGRRLAPRLRYDDVPPFENTYEDHARYLGAILGHDVDAAIDHFRRKLPAHDSAGAESADENDADPRPAEVLVRLLARIGRLDDAIDVTTAHLAKFPEGALSCPSLSSLCLRAHRLDRLAQASRQQNDPVRYLSARLAR